MLRCELRKTTISDDLKTAEAPQKMISSNGVHDYTLPRVDLVK